MDRIINAALKTALLLAAGGSLVSFVIMFVGMIAWFRYDWWATVVFACATLVLAAAIRLRDNVAVPQQPVVG